MRSVSLAMHVSLDGYVAGPAGELEWIFTQVDDEVTHMTLDYLTSIDTMLMGRVTYEEQAAVWPTRTGPIAPIVNGHEKVVFSTTLAAADWANSRVAARPPTEEIEQMKRQPGGTIGVSGGSRFADGLLREGLIDELRLTVHPVLLVRGLPLTTTRLRLDLLDTRRFATGAVTHKYRPESKRGSKGR